MSQTTFRDCLSEIDNLIAADRSDEARKRCQVILQSFPKNLATYRMIGQASLNDGLYQEASDIFLRLLSSLPDDFVAHLGLSVIREQEGKIDAAAWHMARALEAKPASLAIQGEVARLASLQSGQPLQAAPVTRAALARLYLQGGCYPQATAEAQAAQAENPGRMDVLILLAEAYEQAGQQTEALQTCRSALQKLPYSLEANRILFEAALRGPAQDQAIIYRQRLQELDPYWAYVTPDALNPALVPDRVVMFEMID